MAKSKIILLISGLVMFALVAWGAMSGALFNVETVVYNTLHLLPDSMSGFFKAATMFGETWFIISLLAVILIFNRKTGKYIVTAAVGNVALNLILKFIFCRPRPEFEHLVKASGYSFPSGHTMITVSLYGFILFLVIRNIKNKGLKGVLCTLLVCLMILIPMSRLYLGVHFFGDVLGGIFIAGTYIIFFIEMYKKKVDVNIPVKNK